RQAAREALAAYDGIEAAGAHGGADTAEGSRQGAAAAERRHDRQEQGL
ncbi:WYL domain-containing protein, partial [Streptomyces rubrogriseus]|nr:WYL domain-containing protein [Streptomyces rubrogriseus]